MATRIGELEVSYGARGGASYRIELWHEGLKKHRVIKGSEAEIVHRKASLQVEDWDKKWREAEAREQERRSKEGIKRQQETNKKLAADRTTEAQNELERLKRVLEHTLTVDDAIDWDLLKDMTEFPEAKPTQAMLPHKPEIRSEPIEPTLQDAAYQPRFGLLDRLLSSRQPAIVAACQARFEEDYERWKQVVAEVNNENSGALRTYETSSRRIEEEHRAATERWEQERRTFQDRQRRSNEMVAKQRSDYLAAVPQAIIEYCDMVLSASDYPDCFPQEFQLDYNPETKILVVEYALPAPDALPTLRAVKFVQSRDELTEQHLSQAQVSKLYDDLLYQITLRTIHELFEADAVNAIGTVVFNGIVTSVDRATGKEVTACVLSLQAQRDEFIAINLANVDPKVCFKGLKGVGSSKLHGLAAIPPIMQIRREDGRFVSAQEIAQTLDESSNLAAMDWQDFEHLIREVFEQEFSSAGGEVKVTRASRDGGVDAIAFDPDPIRGGKIVIQAKRYANTVGVSAVRDLYGTVMNEGATKGVLVTTSDYGPDAYSFANGKPLILLNGSNLLHMLEKHGHKARIDLQEARRIAMGEPGLSS